MFQATDADGRTQGDGRIRYSLESDNSITHKGNVFSIDEDTGELSIVDKVETMDTPRGQYELVVRATDFGNLRNSNTYICCLSRELHCKDAMVGNPQLNNTTSIPKCQQGHSEFPVKNPNIG